MNEVLRFYFLTTKLKHLVRTGWKKWNVPAKRLESVAEHIFSACMLAIAIESEEKFALDLKHTIMMIVCHELEEIVIGDITQFEGVTEEDKNKRGLLAIEEVLGKLIKKEEYASLLEEFNERKTKESKFAYYCDKFDCDLQAKIYDDYYNLGIENLDDAVKENPKVKEMIQSGKADTMGSYFIEYDRYRYKDTPEFLKLLDELKVTNTSFVLEEIYGKKE